MLWRVKADLCLPVIEFLPDGAYLAAGVSPKLSGLVRHQGQTP